MLTVLKGLRDVDSRAAARVPTLTARLVRADIIAEQERLLGRRFPTHR